MENQTLDIKTELQILKPVKEVFEAIVDPLKMSNFLACLKAYLEYGINLRKGAFDFMKDEA